MAHEEFRISVDNIAVGNKATKSMPIDRPGIEKYFDKSYAGEGAHSISYQEVQGSRSDNRF